MFINERMKPHELLFYEALAARTALTKNESKNLSKILKGYEGELLYDEIFDSIGHDNIIIYRDVCLNIDNSITQYDSLIVSDKGIISNEIKNFTGNCSVSNGNWTLNNFPITKDAFSQLNRSVGKLMDMRNISQSDFTVSGKIIFPNDTFVFNSDDQTNWNKIILRSGLRDYFRQFNHPGVISGNKA